MSAVQESAKAIVKTFAKDKAPRFQNGKIIAQNMVPVTLKPPILMDWVVLETGVITDWENNPINKIFSIISGKGKVFIGDDVLPIGFGDVVWCPQNTRHHFEATEGEALQFTVTKWNG